MKKLIIILLLLPCLVQAQKAIPVYINSGTLVKRDTANGLVATSPLSIISGGSSYVDTITFSGGGSIVNASPQKVSIGRSSTELTYSNLFYDTTKFWLGLNTITPAGVVHIYPNFPGTITTTSGSASVTGTNTLFLSNFLPGDTISYGAETRPVLSIASNTALTLASNAGTNNTNVAYTNVSTARGLYRLDENGVIYRYGKRFIYTSPRYLNSSFGLESMSVISTGSNNTALGYHAMYAATTAASNTAIGHLALEALTTGGSNTAIGSGALKLSNGFTNVAIGLNALTAATSASNNTAVGVGAGLAISTGASNTAIGADALRTMTTVSNNTAVGVSALRNATGANNTAIGFNAAFSGTSGSSNTLVGYQAGFSNLTGIENVSIGYEAMYYNTGSQNTAVGYRALDSVTTGTQNTSLGYASLYNATTGGQNVAIGFEAGRNKGADSTANTAPALSIFIGKNSRANGASQINQIVIGAYAVGNGSNTATIGNSSLTDVYLTGTTHISAGIQAAYVAKTSTYTATALDYLIDCTSGTFTVTLPTAVGITGRMYKITNSGAGTITIGTTSSQTFVNIDAAPTTLTLAAVGAGAIVEYELTSNGANWVVTGKVKNE